MCVVRTAMIALVVCATLQLALADEPQMGNERVVMQTEFGDITFGFYHEVAPITAAHILKLFRLGAYNSNHIFRVDKGFVAQVQAVAQGRSQKMDALQAAEEAKRVPLEVVEGVVHTRGVVSMGRLEDPNSGGSSFSILLGAAPHLDMHYTIFGKMTAGWETLDRLVEVETFKQGIFVMPKKRITIYSTYVYSSDGAVKDGGAQQGQQVADNSAQDSEDYQCPYPKSGLAAWGLAGLILVYAVMLR